KIRIRRFESAAHLRLHGGVLEFIKGEWGEELLTGILVVVAAVRPEQKSKITNLAECCRIDRVRSCNNLLEEPLLAYSKPRQLVIDDRVDRDRGLDQPVRQGLLARVELPETIGPKFKETGVADALHDPVGRVGRILGEEGHGQGGRNE